MTTDISGSFKWFITVGTNPGYVSSNSRTLAEEEFVACVLSVSDLIQAETGVYISALAYPAKAFYKTDWGCPESGEPVYCLTGVCNPVFSEAEDFKSSLVRFTQELKKKLNQTTVTLEIVPCELYYFKGE